MNQVTIKNIKYNILAEIELDGKAKEGACSHMALLKRPNGHKEFIAMRMKHNGLLEIID
jgi:hypothetical protein